MKSFYGTQLPNPLMLGTAQYPSPAILEQAFRQSGASVATVSLRREGAGGAGASFWKMIQDLGVLILPNTAGCHTVKKPSPPLIWHAKSLILGGSSLS